MEILISNICWMSISLQGFLFCVPFFFAFPGASVGDSSSQVDEGDRPSRHDLMLRA